VGRGLRPKADTDVCRKKRGKTTTLAIPGEKKDNDARQPQMEGREINVVVFAC
jgi:hypothetical protein